MNQNELDHVKIALAVELALSATPQAKQLLKIMRKSNPKINAILNFYGETT